MRKTPEGLAGPARSNSAVNDMTLRPVSTEEVSCGCLGQGLEDAGRGGEHS